MAKIVYGNALNVIMKLIKMKEQQTKKCHMCRGKGIVPTEKRLKKFPDIKITGICLYCGGKGFRIKNNISKM